MKIENVKVGMRVVVNKCAFKKGGSMGFLSYCKTFPENRNATVKSICGNWIGVELECDSQYQFIEAEEIDPIVPIAEEIKSIVPKYYLYNDGIDTFVVESYKSESGTVVCVLKGNEHTVGEYSDDWDFDDFYECKFEVLKC